MHAKTARIITQHEAVEQTIIGTRHTGRASSIRNSRTRSHVDPAMFDYDEVSDDVAKFLRVRASRICNHAVSCVVNVGSDLAAAKHYLSHGRFVRWVESEVGMQARTAQIYMQAARWLRGKNATVAHLPVSTIYLLSARSTPVEFATDALRRLEAGEQISASSIKAELRNLKRRRNDFGRRGNAAEPDGVADDRLPATCGASCGCEAPISHQLAMSLVGILAAGLSDADFKYVRRIMTDDAVAGDVHLAKRLVAILPESVAVKGEPSESLTTSVV